jgi:Raf kinase inhibitor-like YbhB/YbcL family protein
MMKGNVFMSMVLAGVFLAGTIFAADFRITSPDLEKGKIIGMDQVFNSFGCTGKNISPALNWEGAPKNTKSFALMVYDPDAPTGSGWWHWVVFNMPASVNSLPRDAGNPATGLMPAGSIQSRTDFGTSGYGGPCPPQGDKPHRYHFTLYALDIDKLPLDANVSPAMVGFMVHQHTLGKTEITATFSR